MIMIVGGPNERTDYHINETEEFFYQLKGDMLLKTVQGNEFVDVPIREGDIFLLPANMPHSPQRYANTIGLVVESRRTTDQVDRLRWYCAQCKCVIKEASLKLSELPTGPLNLGAALKPIILEYNASVAARTCPNCNWLN